MERDAKRDAAYCGAFVRLALEQLAYESVIGLDQYYSFSLPPFSGASYYFFREWRYLVL